MEKLVLEGNLETCPRCGKMAEGADGTFKVADDTIEVLAAPELTRERLARLSEILNAGRAGLDQR